MNCKCLGRMCFLLIAGCSLAVTVGCGGGDNVTGKVTFDDGTPVKGGSITFSGSDIEEFATIGEDGTYEVKEGLKDGDYEVLVTWTEEQSADAEAKEDDENPTYGGEAKPLVHLDYSTPGKTPLKYTSPGGDADFKVKKP
jgi:hypothetical protein